MTEFDPAKSAAQGVNGRLRVNGTEHDRMLDPRTTLLDALRERLRLTGSKKGCDQGQCGNLLDLMKLQIETPTHLIDVNDVGLDRIEATQDGGLKIGAQKVGFGADAAFADGSVRSGSRTVALAEAAEDRDLVAEDFIEYGSLDKDYQQSTLGAHFVEVAVDAYKMRSTTPPASVRDYPITLDKLLPRLPSSP